MFQAAGRMMMSLLPSVAFTLLLLLDLGSCQYKVLLITEADQPEMLTNFQNGISRVQNSAANVSQIKPICCILI